MIGKTVEEPSIAIFPFKSDELAEPPLSLPHAAPTTAIDATVVMSAVFFIQDMINFPPRSMSLVTLRLYIRFPYKTYTTDELLNQNESNVKEL